MVESVAYAGEEGSIPKDLIINSERSRTKEKIKRSIVCARLRRRKPSPEP